MMKKELSKTLKELGSPYYISPEQINDKDPTNKVDIWALGVILYYMCSFQVPFDAKNSFSIPQKILTSEPPDLPEFISTELKFLVKDLLLKDPEKRPSII